MADEPENKAVADAPEGAANPSKTAAIIRLALAGVIVAGAAGGGYFTARLFARSAKAEQPAEAAEEHKETSKKTDEEFSCYKMESIIANLDEPRLARYVRATLALSIRTPDYAAASAALDKNKVKIKDWVTRYLMGCKLDDVRGRENHNRIRKEIQASLNEQLWPQGRPLIAEVFFEEFNVQ
jgi:flagellar basal body-associated protein FliL